MKFNSQNLKENPNSVSLLKQQVHNLRHDLAEKSALLVNVQKQLGRGQNGLEGTTGRVIEQLQAEIDQLKKEVTDSKGQIHVVKVARERAERQLQEHLNSHDTFRTEIDSLKRMLERKERQLKELENSMKDIDKRNVDMKFERDNANTKLRQSELKVSSLERKLNDALACKEQAEHEYLLLSKEMQNFKRRYAEDVDTIKEEFSIVRNELNTTTQQLEDVILMTGVKIEEMTSGRKNELENLETTQAKLKENQEKCAAQFLTDIEKMKQDVEVSNKKTLENIDQVVKMKAEISGKLNWLKRIEKAQIAS
ncbi:hypothetical protein G9A89_014844 [Geosiphon pyriformis]|nr:hypothetical protein G9A89_014844 [Geosiphon pyriformis]